MGAWMKMAGNGGVAARLALMLLAGVLLTGAAMAAEAEGNRKTLTVSAEGLVDPKAPQYARDKGIMVDDLRRDARRQAVEKAVGVYVDSSTLTQNYTMISDRVLTKAEGMIKSVIKESPPWEGEDGFMHMLLKAEVYIGSVEEALKEMSQGQRVALLKERGNPKISVAVLVADADRGSEVEPTRSAIAENILKERITTFGYRVFSEEASKNLKAELVTRSQLQGQSDLTLSVSQLKSSDISILGEAKFKKLSAKLPASGITVTKHALTSWTVVARDNVTGEELYFNNKVPHGRSWNDEDAALKDIGQMIGAEFSKDFFEGHLSKPSRIFQLQVLGLPDYDTGELVRKEFLGLRPVLNADFRNFDASGMSLFEIEFAGGRQDFNRIVNDTVVRPLNDKMQEKAFSLQSAHGELVRIGFNSGTPATVSQRLSGMAPASLAQASPARIAEIAKSPEAMKRVEQINPGAVKALKEGGDKNAGAALGALKGF